MSTNDPTTTLELQAPAKLNLYLEILGKRPDGYHELESLMVTVDLHDHLRFTATPTEQIEITSNDPTLPLGLENLIARAAVGLRQRTGVRHGVTIHVEKAIPVGAGLAGGSSDAATTLVALDRLWNLDLPTAELRSIAATIGSDVSFFLDAPSAVCRGRGEIVEPLPLRHRYHFVLICPPFGVSTVSVYRGLQVPESPRTIDAVLDAWNQGDTEELGKQLFNRLQPVAERIAPDLCRVRDALDALSPSLDGCLMSGSGSAYFGLARDRDAAEQAARQLGRLGLGRVRVVTCGP